MPLDFQGVGGHSGKGWIQGPFPNRQRFSRKADARPGKERSTPKRYLGQTRIPIPEFPFIIPAEHRLTTALRFRLRCSGSDLTDRVDGI